MNNIFSSFIVVLCLFPASLLSQYLLPKKKKEEEEKEERKSLFKNNEVNVLKLGNFQVRGMKFYAQLQIKV